MVRICFFLAVVKFAIATKNVVMMGGFRRVQNMGGVKKAVFGEDFRFILEKRIAILTQNYYLLTYGLSVGGAQQVNLGCVRST